MQTPISAQSWDEQKLENAQVLEKAVTALLAAHPLDELAEEKATCESSTVDQYGIDFSHLWNDVRVVRDVFKDTRPVDPDIRQELWERLGAFCEAAKEIQNRQRDRRHVLEEENRGKIEAAIKALQCGHDLQWAEDISALKADLKVFWDEAREVSRLFKECKPLRREDREELWLTFQELCEKAHYYQNEAIEEGQRRYQEWRARATEKLEGIRHLLSKNADVLTRLQEQIVKCEEMRDSARSAEFGLEVQGWIDDKHRKMQDIHATNTALLEKAEDLEKRLLGEIR